MPIRELKGSTPPRAIVFDVDGTLYVSKPVQRGMLKRLALAHLFAPLRGAHVVRGLSAFRKAQETLRGGPRSDDLHRAQLAEAERTSGVSADEIDALVTRWMEEEPLDLVLKARRPGLLEFVARARAADIKLGVLSDYPAEAKVDVLGLAPYVDAVACAQLPQVGAFKPNPAGLLHVLAELDVAPEQSLYIGDRPEVDGAVADAAGTIQALIGTPQVPGFEHLGAVLFGSSGR